MFCTKCGNKIYGSEKYCTKCGASLERQEEQLKKKIKKNTKIGCIILIIVIVIAVLLLKKMQFSKNHDSEGITTEEIQTSEISSEEIKNEAIEETDAIDYPEKYIDLIYEQIGVVTERKIEICDEDIELNGDFYHVNNPNKSNYLGVLGSKLTDLNQDGEKEVFAVCMDEENYGDEKQLRISLKEYTWNNKGKVRIELPTVTPDMRQPYVVVGLWDTNDSEYEYQRRIDWQIFYTEKDNVPYIINLGRKEEKYKDEYEVSVFSIEDRNHRVYRKLGYRWDFSQNRPSISYEAYDTGGYLEESDNAFGVDNEFYSLLNSMINTLAGYGVNISILNDETKIALEDKCELIGAVKIEPNTLGEISGYHMILDGDIIPANEEENIETLEVIPDEQKEANRTTVNYQRAHEISEYEDLMLTMEICFWDESFEDVNSIKDISTYIACFVPYDYPYEIYESWYNTETGVYEISGEIVRKTMNKYFAFHDLKLEEHLPLTPNHDQGNYWYDQEKDMYYGWIGGFGGTHDGYSDIKFEILDYGVVKAIGTWNMEDGSFVTTEIVVEESEDGLIRLKSYKHSVGAPIEYSLAELEQMALEYRKRHDLFECKVAVDSEEGDMVLIHCYDFIVDNPATGEGHTATSDWYTVNRYTAIGTNDAGEYIDLKN